MCDGLSVSILLSGRLFVWPYSVGEVINERPRNQWLRPWLWSLTMKYAMIIQWLRHNGYDLDYYIELRNQDIAPYEPLVSQIHNCSDFCIKMLDKRRWWRSSGAGRRTPPPSGTSIWGRNSMRWWSCDASNSSAILRHSLDYRGLYSRLESNTAIILFARGCAMANRRCWVDCEHDRPQCVAQWAAGVPRTMKAFAIYSSLKTTERPILFEKSCGKKWDEFFSHIWWEFVFQWEEIVFLDKQYDIFPDSKSIKFLMCSIEYLLYLH